MAQSRVLLVHDEGLDDAVEALLDVECSVVTAERIETAVDWLDRTDFDCIVTARTFSDGDFSDLDTYLSENGDQLPVVLYDEIDTPGQVPTRVTRHIARGKPTAATQLQRTIDHVLTSTDTKNVGLDSADRTVEDPDAHAPSTEEIAHTLEAAPVGVTLTDPSLPDNPIVYANDAYQELTGYTPEEVLGRNERFLQGPETDPEDIATLQQAIENEESTSLEMLHYRADGTAFWNRVTIAPIYSGTELQYYVSVQEDVTARREAEERAQRRAASLHEERQSLDRTIDRLQTLFDRLGMVMTQARDREAILHQILDVIEEIDGYRGGWAAKTRHRRGEATAEIVDGTGPADPDLRITLDSGGPVSTAFDANSVETATSPEVPSAAIDPVEYDATTLVAIPLSYQETVYGLLGVYVDRALVPDDRETALMEAIGRILGNAINAVRTKQALHSDTVLSLEFTIADSDLLLPTVARTLESAVSYQRYDSHIDAGPRLHIVVSDPPTEMKSKLQSIDGVNQVVSIVDRDDRAIVSLTVNRFPMVELLTDHGLEIVTLSATPTETSCTVTTPVETDVRRIVETLSTQFEQVELISQRERSSSERAPGEFIAAVREDLTERQYAALETAFSAGYFEWPRPVEGEELADSMGITRQTFHQHLRTAERKLLTKFFDST